MIRPGECIPSRVRANQLGSGRVIKHQSPTQPENNPVGWTCLGSSLKEDTDSGSFSQKRCLFPGEVRVAAAYRRAAKAGSGQAGTNRQSAAPIPPRSSPAHCSCCFSMAAVTFTHLGSGPQTYQQDSPNPPSLLPPQSAEEGLRTTVLRAPPPGCVPNLTAISGLGKVCAQLPNCLWSPQKRKGSRHNRGK